MNKSLSLKELYEIYKRWVVSNPGVVTDAETVATWSSYFVAGKINKSPIVSELVYSLSKLVSLFNDRLIREAYGTDEPFYGLREQIKLWLTVVHYCEVFVELLVKNRWGTRGKWTIATLLQVFKCSSALVLLFRFKELPVAHPPIAALQRKKFTEGKETDENSNSFFTLQRSGRVIRRVDGAPSVAFRNWEPVKLKDDRPGAAVNVKDLIYAESLHILKPLIHLASMRIFGTKAWKQWIVAICMDIASMKIYSKYMKDLSYDQRLEISRRRINLILYLLRSPLYNGYTRNVIENALNSMTNKISEVSRRLPRGRNVNTACNVLQEDALLSVHKATESDRRDKHEAMEGIHRCDEHEAMEGGQRRNEHEAVEGGQRHDEHEAIEGGQRRDEHEAIEGGQRHDEHEAMEGGQRRDEHEAMEGGQRLDEHEAIEGDQRRDEHEAMEGDRRREEHEDIAGFHRQGHEANLPQIEILMVDEYSERPAANLDYELRMAGLDTLMRIAGLNPVRALATLAEVLHIQVDWDQMHYLHIVTLSGVTPVLTFSSRVQEETAMTALTYLRVVLQNIPKMRSVHNTKSL